MFSLEKFIKTNKNCWDFKQVIIKLQMNYYNSRAYESRIGAWASKQSNILKDRDELLNLLKILKKNIMIKISSKTKTLVWLEFKPSSIEFWLDGDNRIHERLKYTLDKNNNWLKIF